MPTQCALPAHDACGRNDMTNARLLLDHSLFSRPPSPYESTASRKNMVLKVSSVLTLYSLLVCALNRFLMASSYRHTHRDTNNGSSGRIALQSMLAGHRIQLEIAIDESIGFFPSSCVRRLGPTTNSNQPC